MSAAHLVGEGEMGTLLLCFPGHCRRARGQAQSPLSEAGEGEVYSPYSDASQPAG